MKKTAAKLGAALLLSVLVVPIDAHAANGCQANPVQTSCTYVAGGGDIHYTGVEVVTGSITIFRNYATSPGSGCPKWSSTNTACLIHTLILPLVTGGGSPIPMGTISTFKNQATGAIEDTPRAGDRINVSAAGDTGTPLGRSSGVLKVDDAA